MFDGRWIVAQLGEGFGSAKVRGGNAMVVGMRGYECLEQVSRAWQIAVEESQRGCLVLG
jgi:hypothetical protein